MPGMGMTVTSPAQLQQQANNLRATLMVTNDDEWAVISPRLVKVIQLKAEVEAAEFANMLSNMAGRRGGGIRAAATAMGVDADPNSAALTKAIADDAPLAELKSAIARVRNAHKAKQAEIPKAQADLLDVVDVPQEVILLSRGLLE